MRLSDMGAQFVARAFCYGFAHVDPDKEAKAQAKRLASGTTTISYEMARQGIDPERHFEELAKERKLLRKLGIEVGYLKGTTNNAPQ
jgi:capsid protein